MTFPMSLVETTQPWFPLNLGSKFKPLLHAGSPFRICKKDPLILFHPNFITHVDSIFSCSLLLSDCKDLGTENTAEDGRVCRELKNMGSNSNLVACTLGRVICSCSLVSSNEEWG